MKELLIEIWTSVRRNKLRTALTGFSVGWGIFMLVILLGSGNGLKNGVMSNFESLTVNSIELYGGYTSKPYMGYNKDRVISLVNRDLENIKKEIPEVGEVAAMIGVDGKTATYENKFMKAWLAASLPSIAQIQKLNIVLGRFVNDADIARYRKVVVIDQNMQNILFSGADPLGRGVKIGDSVYTIIGVYKGDATGMEAQCYIPLTTGQLMYLGNDFKIAQAVVTIDGVNTDAQMQSLESRIRATIAAEHSFDPTDESAIYIHNNMEIFKNMSLVFGGINLFVWIIGLGTLLAGIVGVSNIMLVTVTERTSEFGVRKALGAKPSSIIRLILTESVLITAMFGYIGMVLGVGVMEVVNYIIEQMPKSESEFSNTMFLNPTLDLSVAVSATVVLVVAGLIAGYIPAYRAAQLKTIDALRHNK